VLNDSSQTKPTNLVVCPQVDCLCQLLLCILLLLIGSYFSIYCSTEVGRLSDLGTMPTGAAYVKCGLYVCCSDYPNETITLK